jgi:predicted DNA-binding transcriptional regulator AlpA
MRLLRMPAVERKVGLKKSIIYDLLKRPGSKFPKPVHQTSHSSTWVDEELDEYIAEQIRRRDEELAREANDINGEASEQK